MAKRKMARKSSARKGAGRPRSSARTTTRMTAAAPLRESLPTATAAEGEKPKLKSWKSLEAQRRAPHVRRDFALALAKAIPNQPAGNQPWLNVRPDPLDFRDAPYV